MRGSHPRGWLSYGAGLQPEDRTTRIEPLSGATCSNGPLFFPPHLEHPVVGRGNQVALLLTRLPGSQQRSGHLGSSGHSRVTAGRADCQSPASLQSCGNRAKGPKDSTAVYSILENLRKPPPSPHHPPNSQLGSNPTEKPVEDALPGSALK